MSLQYHDKALNMFTCLKQQRKNMSVQNILLATTAVTVVHPPMPKIYFCVTTKYAIYRVFYFLLDQQAPAQCSASVVSYTGCWGSLIADDRS